MGSKQSGTKFGSFTLVRPLLAAGRGERISTSVAPGLQNMRAWGLSAMAEMMTTKSVVVVALNAVHSQLDDKEFAIPRCDGAGSLPNSTLFAMLHTHSSPIAFGVGIHAQG